MALDGNRLQHGLLAKPCPNPVGKNNKRFAIVACVAVEIRLLHLEVRDRERGEADKLEPIPRIYIALDSGEFFVKQTLDRGRLAQGPRSADHDAANGAIDPEKCQLQDAGPLASPFEILFQRCGEERGQGFDVLGQHDRFGEMALDGKRRHRQTRRDRFLNPAERLIEAYQQLFAEPAGKRRSRRRHDHARSAQTDAFETHANGRFDAQG
jgi:hypothetical protein